MLASSVTGEGELPVRDGQGEVFSHVVSANDFSDPDPDRSGLPQPSGFDCGNNSGQLGLGRGGEVFSFVGATLGEGGVAAGDEALGGVVGVGDLGQVCLIEQGLLHRPVGEKPGDRGRAQRGHPAEAAELPELFDPGGGAHAPACDHDHVVHAERGLHLNRDLFKRGPVGRVPGHHPDRDRAAFRVGQQAVLDLWEAFLPGHPPGRYASVQRPGKHVHGQFWFRPELTSRGDPGRIATFPVIRPYLGQIQLAIQERAARWARVGQEYTDLGILDPTDSPGILPGHPGRTLLSLQKPGLINDQHTITGAEMLHHIGPQIIAHRVGVPVGRREQTLHPIRARLTGLLRKRPRVLPLRTREKTAQIIHRVLPRLRPGKTRPDQPTDLLQPLSPLLHLSHTNIIAHPQGLTRTQHETSQTRRNLPNKRNCRTRRASGSREKATMMRFGSGTTTPSRPSWQSNPPRPASR